MLRRTFVVTIGSVLWLVGCTPTEVQEDIAFLPVPVIVDERWQRSGHVLKPPPVSYEPSVTFEQAADEVADQREVLAGRLGLFTDRSYGYMGKRTVVDVPTWVITVRTCVPMHGPPGLKDRPRCASDHLHVVVNAETGGYVQAFAP